ncbi:XrtA-associated tyrosine autokinase [Massilia sp. GCM10020059]|uniref:non-specific protein-tyrosine kinase n=1 Tax=Massilia agrisoli TaxID=2892444 RepID=A0ABS8IR09_9BURK|nr:XrtA-associated tyrosine autokinase [Massilia agrisoli]MCC6070628.1 XrtA-associated tyrosine autokinase [Massilia agrisoli]
MSIIEKAAGRIEHKKEEPTIGSPAPLSAPESIIERSMHAAAPAAPAAAAPAAAAAEAKAAPQHSAPPVAETSIAPRPGARVVELDLARMQSMGLVTAAGGRTALVEDFRIIKRPLLKRAFAEPAQNGRPGNLIMITSSLPGEGKTFCAINLAMSIAMELDHTVLLIDADVARPSVLSTLGLPAHRGLMDVLLDDKLDVADVMLRTNVDTLSIISAGSSNPRATELLASQAMNALVEEIAHRYPDRIVIFDSPPLLLTSEAHVLAAHMGQIVVVVEAEATTQHAVKEALSQLEGLDNVNLIYNKTHEFPGTETYNYNYG